mmetsp:Transcript_19467/g.24044  ORF Transcript_19467/g.24044 Transcript_19467/m.24044 type:complete len:275 (+) Transcript_19467:27-851(+)
MTERKPIIVHTKTGGTQYGSTSQYRQIHQPGSIQQGYVPRSPIVSSPMRSPMKSPFKRATDGVSAFLKSPRKSPMFRAFSPQISKHSVQQLNQTIHANKDLTLNDDDLNIDYTTKDMLEDGEDDGLISIWQAGFSVVNLFLGLCLFGILFAFDIAALVISFQYKDDICATFNNTSVGLSAFDIMVPGSIISMVVFLLALLCIVNSEAPWILIFGNLFIVIWASLGLNLYWNYTYWDLCWNHPVSYMLQTWCWWKWISVICGGIGGLGRYNMDYY